MSHVLYPLTQTAHKKNLPLSTVVVLIVATARMSAGIRTHAATGARMMGTFGVARTGHNRKTFAFRNTSRSSLRRRRSQLTHAFQHFVDLWFQHAEVFDRLELVQVFLQLWIDRHLGSIFVVLKEGPEFLQTVELTLLSTMKEF